MDFQLRRICRRANRVVNETMSACLEINEERAVGTPKWPLKGMWPQANCKDILGSEQTCGKGPTGRDGICHIHQLCLGIIFDSLDLEKCDLCNILNCMILRREHEVEGSHPINNLIPPLLR